MLTNGWEQAGSSSGYLHLLPVTTYVLCLSSSFWLFSQSTPKLNLLSASGRGFAHSKQNGLDNDQQLENEWGLR